MNSSHAHDEYRTGNDAELFGAYWLDTPGRNHSGDECLWCRELREVEAGQSRTSRSAKDGRGEPETEPAEE